MSAPFPLTRPLLALRLHVLDSVGCGVDQRLGT
jgi:hypothetical protein